MTLPLPLPRIWQAPTGSAAGPELAAAVSEAGGLGAMGVTWLDPDAAAAAVRAAREITSRPFQANFVLSFPPKALDAVLDAGAPVVTFSWGSPDGLVERVRSAGAALGIQVVSAEGARRALDHGPDFLVCQGVEAGGHVQSSTSLLDLLPSVVDAAGPVPVVASGGMATGSDIVRALARGASSAMLGTRFVATRESRAHDGYRALLVAATGADSTALTCCFDGGWAQAPHRVLRNSTFTAWEAAGSPVPGNRPGEGDVVAVTAVGTNVLRYSDMAPRLGTVGDVEAMALYAGEGVGGITDVPSVAELMVRLAAEMESAAGKMTGKLH